MDLFVLLKCWIFVGYLGILFLTKLTLSQHKLKKNLNINIVSTLKPSKLLNFRKAKIKLNSSRIKLKPTQNPKSSN